MKILLIGNYAPDRQESMLRYAAALHEGLGQRTHEVRLVAPAARLVRRDHATIGPRKWLGYVDKMLLAPQELHRAAQWADVVHVCDHSNSIYVPRAPKRPWIVTCHDLLAVRGALGEPTDCPASAAGRHLQRMIVAGLERAHRVIAVSEATRRDVRRLVARSNDEVSIIPPPLSFPFRPLDAAEVRRRLGAVGGLYEQPYALMVGSNLRRKNRECALQALALISREWPGQLVFAGEPLSRALRNEAERLGVADRLRDVERPDGELLEALFNAATCLLFPSRFEGFGWPIIEAQACGCPVVASDVPPHPEVSGGAALLCRVDRPEEFAAAILSLERDRALRARLRASGSANACRFSTDAIAERLLAIYEDEVT